LLPSLEIIIYNRHRTHRVTDSFSTPVRWYYYELLFVMWPWNPLEISFFQLVVLPWLISEIIFVGVFYKIWLPKFQKLRPPIDYRDYAKDRKKLFLRILKRIEVNCLHQNKPILPYIQSFVRDWFHTSTPEFSPKKGDVDRFFAWAFFGKHLHDLEPWMKSDMDHMYQILEQEYDFRFPEGFTPEYKPMRLTLDPLTPKWRPFVVYGCFLVIKILGGLLLRAAGFFRCRTSNGLNYFYRPPHKSANQKLPLLFLHGIAPGGLAFYIPMLSSLGGDGRPIFLFENPDITFCFVGGNPMKEHDTVQGIWEAVDEKVGSVRDVSVVGHSFGSCPITWLVHSAHSARIRQIVLVDPVSICLSEPDVMHNFLYKPRVKLAGRIEIGVISSEIFTQHYLRRHFAWYNSELWLEDLPPFAKVLVCLSQQDPIVPVQKVRQQLYLQPKVETLLWEDGGHAHCVTRPQTWKQIQIVMRRQEQLILQESSSSAMHDEEMASSTPSDAVKKYE